MVKREYSLVNEFSGYIESRSSELNHFHHMNRAPLQNCNFLFNDYRGLQIDGDIDSICLVHLRKKFDGCVSLESVSERRVVCANCARIYEEYLQ